MGKGPGHWIQTEAGKKALTENLALVMYVAAARAAADGKQRSRLRMVLGPLIKLHRTHDQSETIPRAIRKILGSDWKPTGAHGEGFWTESDFWRSL